MEIKFSAPPPPAAPTFFDVRVGQVFFAVDDAQKHVNARLKVDGGSYIIFNDGPNPYVWNGPTPVISEVYEIESITLRRVK